MGHSHNMAVTKLGELYTWGEGENQRLGLGFIEEQTPKQLTP